MKQDPIIKKLLEHDKKFEHIDKRFDEMHAENVKFRNDILTAVDKVLVIVQRVDQERVFTFAAVKRLQDQLDNQQKEIVKIKQVLNIK